MSSPDEHTRVRAVAFTEVVHREENEQIAPAPEAGWDLGLVARNCECGDMHCRETVQLTVAEYEGLRADGRRFAVVHDHVDDEAERVVEQHRRYTVVEKVASAGTIAEAHDPRD